MYGLLALAGLIMKAAILAILLMAEAVVIAARLLAVAIPAIVRVLRTGWNRLKYGPVR